MRNPGVRTMNWLVLTVVLLGLASIAVCVTLLLLGSDRATVGWLVTPTWTASPVADQTATRAPTRTPTARWAPTWTATWTPRPTATLTATSMPQPTLAVLATSTPTSTLVPTPISQPEGAPEGTALSLTIVHTNDTWGYTRPCF